MRLLRNEEKALVRKLLDASPSLASLVSGLGSAIVEDMADGGMGSIRFQGKSAVPARRAREVASANFRDFDGTLVWVALNLDQNGELFEIDFWKVDFSPLLQYPRVEDLVLESRRLDG